MYGGFLESIFTGPHYATILLYDRRTTSQACGPSVSTEIRSSPILDLACAQNINVLAHLPAKVLLSGKMANVGRVTSAHNTSHAFCWPCTIISTTTQQRIVICKYELKTVAGPVYGKREFLVSTDLVTNNNIPKSISNLLI